MLMLIYYFFIVTLLSTISASNLTSVYISLPTASLKAKSNSFIFESSNDYN